MGLGSFRGGIHPPGNKELSKDSPIQAVKPGKELVYLLSQHIGAPARPLVKKGDRVLAGQKIAEAAGFVSVPVYASVSGTVKGIEQRLTASGGTSDAVIVENDGLYQEAPPREGLQNPEALSRDEILERIREAGVAGMGGAGFPTHVKLSPKEPEKIDYVLINGAECEPYLTADYRRMLEYPEQVAGGLRILLRLFPNAKGVICIEDNKPECIRIMEQACAGDSSLQVRPLKTKYPQGAERMLIYAVTGRKINSSLLPADAGCVVDNAETAAAVYRAVALGKPVTERIVTVTGDAVARPSNFLAPVGMDHQELLEAAGGLAKPAEKIVSGGPMMGFALFDLHVPVTKTTSGLVCLSADEVSRHRPTACINCGRCVAQCPEHLVPARLARFAQHGDEKNFLKYYGMECCECGCCSYVCPARRPLAQEIKSMRKMVLANRKKRQEGDKK